MSEPGKLIIKQYEVSVVGFLNGYTYEATSRGKALALAYQSWKSFAADRATFKDFMRIASARFRKPDARFGEPITVGGLPAFFVGCNRQYVRFVRPNSDVVLCSHPYDVEPPEARRGTAYYDPDRSDA